jgi:hypothetical protein
VAPGTGDIGVGNEAEAILESIWSLDISRPRAHGVNKRQLWAVSDCPIDGKIKQNRVVRIGNEHMKISQTY